MVKRFDNGLRYGWPSVVHDFERRHTLSLLERAQRVSNGLKVEEECWRGGAGGVLFGMCLLET
jgi:hypothetical protein